MKHTITLYLILLLFNTILNLNTVFAQGFNYTLTGDPVDITGWTKGNNTNVNNDIIELNQPVGFVTGYIYNSTATPLAECSRFTVSFEFRVSNSSNPTADGFTFWYISNPPNNFAVGSGIGLPNNPNGLTLIFDTYNNVGANDVPLISLHKFDGSTNYIEGSSIGRLAPDVTNQSWIVDGAWHSCILTYDYGNISISFDGNPPVMSGYVSLDGINGYFGFSSSTGTYVAKHSVKNVSISGEARPGPPLADNISYCQGETATPLTATGVNLLWYTVPTGGIGSVVPPTPSTTTIGTTSYWVSQTNTSCGESERRQVNVTVNPEKTINLVRAICSNENVVIGDSVFNTTGNHTVVLHTSLGCDSIVNLDLTVIPLKIPSVTVNVNKNDICKGDLVQFTAISNNAGINPIYQWLQNGIPVGTNSNRYTPININNADGVKVIVTTSELCALPNSSESNTITVLVNSIEYNKPAVVYCAGDSVLADLSITSTPQSTYTVFWDNGNDTSTTTNATHFFHNTVSANIPFRIKYGRNCLVNDNLHITVNPLPQVGAISDKHQAKYEEQVQLDVNTNADIISYNWMPADNLDNAVIKSPRAILKGNTWFYVTAKDGNNCYNTDSIFVSLINECINAFIYIPTAFSPNRDGINDCFGIISPPKISNYKMEIYNRWGEKVFQSNNIDICWDGNFKGIEVQSDTYTYIISYICYDGTFLSKNGTLLLLR